MSCESSIAFRAIWLSVAFWLGTVLALWCLVSVGRSGLLGWCSGRPWEEKLRFRRVGRSFRRWLVWEWTLRVRLWDVAGEGRVRSGAFRRKNLGRWYPSGPYSTAVTTSSCVTLGIFLPLQIHPTSHLSWTLWLYPASFCFLHLWTYPASFRSFPTCSSQYSQQTAYGRCNCCSHSISSISHQGSDWPSHSPTDQATSTPAWPELLWYSNCSWVSNC